MHYTAPARPLTFARESETRHLTLAFERLFLLFLSLHNAR
jgi:hypothetical protein